MVDPSWQISVKETSHNGKPIIAKPGATVLYSVSFRACLHGGGGPQVGEVTCGGSPHLSCNRDKIKMRDYIDRWVTPPKQVTSPTWGPPPPFKQALSFCFQSLLQWDFHTTFLLCTHAAFHTIWCRSDPGTTSSKYIIISRGFLFTSHDG